MINIHSVNIKINYKNRENLSKDKLIQQLLQSTIFFLADGDNICISQFDDGAVVYKNGKLVPDSILYEYNHFEVPDSWDTPYGVMLYSFGGDYEF